MKLQNFSQFPKREQAVAAPESSRYSIKDLPEKEYKQFKDEAVAFRFREVLYVQVYQGRKERFHERLISHVEFLNNFQNWVFEMVEEKPGEPIEHYLRYLQKLKTFYIDLGRDLNPEKELSLEELENIFLKGGNL